MTDKIVVLVTAGSGEEAERIARALVQERLAACVNIVNPIGSVYRWEGKVTEDSEVLLVIKSSRPLFDQVRHLVENLHSYHVPEVICLPIVDGSENYLNWLADSLGPDNKPTVPVPARKPPAKMPSLKKKSKRKTKKPGRKSPGK